MMFELRVKFGRKVIFSGVGTLESCTEWINLWQNSSSSLDCSYTYSLYPRTK
jgi:hypothetical protein